MSLGSRLPEIDVLIALYKQDPAEFEALRRELLREAVGRASLEQRPALEAILRQIEAARDATSSPIESMLLAFKLMQESMAQLQNSWAEVQQAVAALQTALIIERLRKRDPR